LQHRVVSRLAELGEFLHREAWLAHRDPCPPARRARKFADTLAKFKAATRPQQAPAPRDVQ
jgi:hypothetical protein